MKRNHIVKRRKQSKPARHAEASPYACVGELRLSIESNPLVSVVPHKQYLVTERCLGCGRVLNVWGVLPEPELVNNDDADDCA